MLSAFVALGTLVGITFSLALLFLPTLVAKFRRHPNVFPIFLVNLFFGWSFVGWVIALVWACTRPAATIFYAVYPTVIAPPHRPAVSNSAAAILLPPSPYRRWR